MSITETFGPWISNEGNPDRDHPNVADWHPDDRVQVKLRNGDISTGALNYWTWDYLGDDDDIISYRFLATHPAYQHAGTLPKASIPEELIANPLFGQWG